MDDNPYSSGHGFVAGVLVTFHTRHANKWHAYPSSTQRNKYDTLEEVWGYAPYESLVEIELNKPVVFLESVKARVAPLEWYVKLLHPDHGTVVIRLWGRTPEHVWMELAHAG